jgi:hypothetical protein
MIMAFLARAWASVLSLPAWARQAILIALACVALLTVHKCAVRDAVKADRAAQAAKVAERVIAADRAANRAGEAQRAADRTQDAETRKALSDAEAKDLDSAKRPAGASVRAVADSLRP